MQDHSETGRGNREAAVTEKPAEQPPEAKPAEKPEEKPAAVPVSDEEVRVARGAIARAREADAEYYEPELLKQAEDALDAALAQRESDPDKARELLAEAKARADEAFDGAVAKAAADLDGRLERMKAELLAEKADRFLPDEYERAVAGIPEVRRLYGEGELVEAREKAYATLAEMSGLLERLRERKRWVETLKQDINRNLAEAEELGAQVRAPEAFDRANQLYLQGIDEYQGFQLAASEETLAQAREASQEAVRLAGGRRQEEKAQARSLMLEVMRLLEEASTLTVVTDEGTVIRPSPGRARASWRRTSRESPTTSPCCSRRAGRRCWPTWPRRTCWSRPSSCGSRACWSGTRATTARRRSTSSRPGAWRRSTRASR